MINFFLWHYSSGIRKFFQIWKNYLEFFWNYFSMGRFFFSLFSPWKRDISRINQEGLHPILFLQSLLENILTRILGAIVRSFIILLGFIFEIIAIILGSCLFLIWMTFFFSLAVSLVAIVFLLTQELSPVILIWGSIFLTSVILNAISFFSYRNKDKDYWQMDISDLAKEKWFSRVWNRIGKNKIDIDQNILNDNEQLNNYLQSLDLTLEDFLKIISWEISNQIERRKRKSFWTRDNLMAIRPIGRYWSYAYTVHLDKYSKDFSMMDFRGYRNAKLAEREKELDELKQILLRPNQNNVILIGEYGIGKETIIHILAEEIRNNEVGESFISKRILEIDIKKIITDLNSKSEGERVLGLLFSEAAYAGNIILVLRNIHEYLDQVGSFGQDISSVISEFLALPTFQIIGTTVPAKFHSTIENKGNIMKYCEKILVNEMGAEDTLEVLHCKLEELEVRQIFFTYQAMKELIKLADRYNTAVPFPEKALDFMEEVILYWNNNVNSQFITQEVVDNAISIKINVPLGEISVDESEKLLNLENYLHKRVIGQEFAIRQISETMRRARIGMAEKNKPIGSFLFLGPTGVGKTESAKALAEAYFGSENRMIRLDMSEYQTQESIDRLIGSSESEKEGYLVDKIKETPYALLLLDEIEKAYPDILNLFLQVLDEGHLTDAFGNKVDFRNLIIIATSNVGAEIIKEGVSNNLDPDNIKGQVIDFAIKSGIFRPEFLNRFEDVIFFHSLSSQEVYSVTKLLLEKYSKKLEEQENIQIAFNEDVVEAIAKKAYNPMFGARAIDRYIQDKVGDNVVEKIIAKKIKKGSKFIFVIDDLKV